MTPKTSESLSHDEALYIKWNKTSFELLLQTFCIRPEWHPVMPSERDTAFPLMDDKITLFAFFSSSLIFGFPLLCATSRCLMTSFTLAHFLYLEKSVSILAVDRPLHFGEESILGAHVGYFLISPSHMEGVLQGFPTSGGVEESGAAVTAPKKIIRIRRGGWERSANSQSSRDASLATSTTTAEVVEVPAANVGITSVVAPVGPPLKKIKTYVLLMANFEAKRRVVLAGIGKYLHLF
ncbi:hypothetical protein Hanom_Chr05g00430061 [Helianthus anomalus]